jgi:glycine oxidase
MSFLADCAVEQIDRYLAATSVLETRVGNRPIPADTYPLLGETSVPGLWLATGTYRDGFLLAPLIAKRVQEAIITDKRYVDESGIFAPERPPIQVADYDVAIQESVENFLAIAYERRTRLPAVGQWEDDLQASIKRRVLRIYETLGAEQIIPPDFLWDLSNERLLSTLRDYYRQVERVWSTKT